MDDDDREGRTTRNLFRTDSDSDEDDDDSTQEATSDAPTMVRRVLHVELEERTVGGSIEHRLWPAAEYLASFVLQILWKDSAAEAPQRTREVPGKYATLERLRSMLQRASSLRSGDDVNCATSPFKILELGAGVGLTGLELASQMECQVLLTDLESALPLLRSNVERNRHQFAAKSTTASTVQVQKLEWGKSGDIDKALEWYLGTEDHLNEDTLMDQIPPLLVLGSDCVYWESLYQPLEETIASLLQFATPGSVCLLAGMRRWKRDNHFYQQVLGKSTATANGQLECLCLDEQVTRMGDTGERQVMRIYAVQWVAK
jgi:Lysine methyltransferase